MSGTVEIRYDRSRAGTWCAACSGAAVLCGDFVTCLAYGVVKLLSAAREGVLLPVSVVSGLILGASALWLAARTSWRYWRKFRRRSPVLTLAPDAFRDERVPIELRWADVRGLRLRTETVNGWESASVVEVRADRGGTSVSVVVDLLGPDRTPEEIFGLLERYMKTVTGPEGAKGTGAERSHREKRIGEA